MVDTMSRAKSESTRERLLDVATRLLVERGLHQVGMDEIAREAGISRQAIYQGHFSSKAELLLALVRRVDELADIPRRAGRVRQARNGVEALEIAVEVVMSIERDVHDIARVFEAARREDPAFEAAWQDEMRRRRRVAHPSRPRFPACGRLPLRSAASIQPRSGRPRGPSLGRYRLSGREDVPR